MNGTELILVSILAAMPNGSIPEGKPVEIDGKLDVLNLGLDLASTNIRTRNHEMPKHLTVTAWQNMPYSGIKKVNGKYVGEGYAFFLLNTIQTKLNFTYDIIVPKNEELGVHENRKYGGVIELLQSKQADMAVSFVPIIPELTEVLSYGNIVDEIDITFMMKRPSVSAIGSGLTAPFTQTVWICILAALIIFGPVIFVIIHYRGKVEESRGHEGYSLGTCVWFAFGALVKQGSNVEPVTDSTRVLFATWWIFITILTSFYTANLTAFLTLSQFTLPFDNVEDIIDARQEWFAYKDQIVDETLKFIKADDPKDMRHLRNSFREHLGMYIKREQSENNVLNHLQDEKLFLTEVQMVEKMLYDNYRVQTLNAVQESKRCIYVQLPGVLYARNRAFAYQKNSVIIDHINKHLLNLIEAGFLKHLGAQDVPSVKYCPLDLKSTERQLRNTDFAMTYKIIGAGFGLGIAAFFGELFYKLGQNRKSCGSCSLCCPSKIVHDDDALEYNEDPRPDFLKQKQSPTNDSNSGEERGKKIFINGRDYWVIKEGDGDQRLVPIRTPSALLFDYRS